MTDIMEPKIKQSIYVIEDQANLMVYIDKAKSSQLKEAYKRHRYGRRTMTKNMFEEWQNSGTMPKMYLLEEVELTEREAYKHMLAWARYFHEYGFQLLCGKKFYSQVMDIHDETELIYHEIHKDDLFSLISSEKELFSDYGRKRNHNRECKPSVISISVSEEEYDYIYEKAADLGMSMSSFCRKQIMHGYVQKVEQDVFLRLWEYTDKYRERTNVLKNILRTIYCTKKYYPMDLRIIQEQTEENRRQHIEAMKWCREVLHSLQEDIRNNIDE